MEAVHERFNWMFVSAVDPIGADHVHSPNVNLDGPVQGVVRF